MLVDDTSPHPLSNLIPIRTRIYIFKYYQRGREAVPIFSLLVPCPLVLGHHILYAGCPVASKEHTHP